jgi:aspartate/methionine/tyrosine aminotransferase
MYAMTSLYNDKEVQEQIRAKKSRYFKKLDFLYKELNEIGYKCIKPEGAMYIFPKIPIIPRIEELAEKENKEYDFIWCREFLLKTGVCVIPGSGFRKSGYFRMTVLPNMEDLKYFINSLKDFN